MTETPVFQMCRADKNDVWFRKAKKPDGKPYYEYIIVYADDTLCISMDPNTIFVKFEYHFLFELIV